MPMGKLEGAFLAPLDGYNAATKIIAVAAQTSLINGGYLLSVYFLPSFLNAFGASRDGSIGRKLPQGARKLCVDTPQPYAPQPYNPTGLAPRESERPLDWYPRKPVMGC